MRSKQGCGAQHFGPCFLVWLQVIYAAKLAAQLRCAALVTILHVVLQHDKQKRNTVV
jgi:hypothetical protein